MLYYYFSSVVEVFDWQTWWIWIWMQKRVFNQYLFRSIIIITSILSFWCCCWSTSTVLWFLTTYNFLYIFNQLLPISFSHKGWMGLEKLFICIWLGHYSTRKNSSWMDGSSIVAMMGTLFTQDWVNGHGNTYGLSSHTLHWYNIMNHKKTNDH